MKLLTLPLGLTILATAALYAQQPESPTNANDSPGAASADILAVDNSTDLMRVSVNVGGQGPYPFLVDSGSERTVISRELVEKLALMRGRDVRVHSMTEARTVATALIPQLQVSRRSVTDIHAPSYPAAYIGADGVLGIDSLARQRVIFDFNAQTMAITTSPPGREDSAHDTVIVTGKNMYGRLVLTGATIDGIEVLAIVDTGSPVTIGNEALRKRLTARNRLAPTTPLQLMSITGRRLTVDYTVIGRAQFGSLTVTKLPMGFADVHPFQHLRLDKRPAILLGMDALRLFSRVSVDFARKEVRFQLPNKAGPMQGRLASPAGTTPQTALALK